MSRESAFRGTWSPNKRPYVVVTPDVYVAFQGETSVIGCGECLRQIPINDYVTGISTEASVDSPPGSATINLSIPDNDVNDFYVDGQLLIIPMMEVEIYAKGYYLVGGFPQYYKIFWGIVQSVSKSWSGGTTTVAISCKDILRWWEITMTTTNPGFIDAFGSSAGNFQFWGNQFAGMNPTTIIIALAREAMGDFSVTTGSFLSFLPEHGPEKQLIASYAKDIMAYWQLKFSNIWTSLVIYGSSGQSYTFNQETGTLSPSQISASIFKNEAEKNLVNQETTLFRPQPKEIAAVKQELDKAANFELFQNEQQSKLAIAMTCRDQAGYEFYCDTTGDIVFKPPFYNLNVLPNKPVSWIQDFEIIDDQVTDSEAEVITHITSSGNAFGGTMDWGLNDEITTPRSGAIDFHLLRRYGWRRFDYQCEWAGNPRKLFFHLLDYLDRLNAKRQQGTVTIPMRPELRMGFPIWFPKYDSFFYVQGISHQYSVGGQATTTLNLIAKRSKFVAPNNIGTIEQSGVKEVAPIGKNETDKRKRKFPTYTIKFPTRAGSTTGQDQSVQEGEPIFLRDPKTGKMLGYPNVVMVYRTPHNGTTLSNIMERMGQPPPKNRPQTQKSKTDDTTDFNYKQVVDVFKQLQGEQKTKIIQQLRAHRYEAGMTNAGTYDYAFDVSRSIKELELIPTDSVIWQPEIAGGDQDSALNLGPTGQAAGATSEATKKTRDVQKQADIDAAKKIADDAQKTFTTASNELRKARKDFDTFLTMRNAKASKTVKNPADKLPPPTLLELEAKGIDKNVAEFLLQNKAAFEGDTEVTAAAMQVILKQQALEQAKKDLAQAKAFLLNTRKNLGAIQRLASLNMMVRPVSDEFGFEVIGHYKYGRGSFIDRGQLQISTGNPQRLANELNVQFAPSGGFLTDPSITGDIDEIGVSFSDAFEKMQPDDYVTGASFKGYASDMTGGPTNIVQTSQNTYTNLVNANTGKSTFIEADALRKSKTLGELVPTIDLPGLDAAHKPCDCGLSRNNWLTVLPVDLIKEIVNREMFGAVEEPLNKTKDPEAQEKIDAINQEINNVIAAKQKQTDASIAALQKKKNPDTVAINDLQIAMTDFSNTQEVSRSQRVGAVPQTKTALTTDGADPNTDVFRGNINTGAFFDALQNWLQSKFIDEYKRANAPREQAYTVRDKTLNRAIQDPVSGKFIFADRSGLSPLFGNPEDNVLGDPSDPLFAAASHGDPAALQAIEQKANFNFGSTQKALTNLKDAWSSGQEKIKVSVHDIKFGNQQDAFNVSTSGHFDASSGPQTQPYGTPLPLPTIISQVDVSHLKSVTVGSAILNAPIIIPNDQNSPSEDRTVAPAPPLGYAPAPAAAQTVQIITVPKKL